MTELEAQDWVVRLTRIWVMEVPDDTISWRLHEEWFSFSVMVSSDICFRFSDYPTFKSVQGRRSFALGPTLDGEPLGGLRHHSDQGTQVLALPLYGSTDSGLLAQFTNHWMPFFRRNCWLSGADIEASAHEKLEWLQGFSPEEIHAWNLKV